MIKSWLLWQNATPHTNLQYFSAFKILLTAKCLFNNFNDSPDFYSTEYENTKN